MDELPTAAPLTIDWFQPLKGQSFGLRADEATLEMVLADVAPQRVNSPGDARRAFSLMFEGTAGRLCPQGTYRLHNDAVGALDIFLVPIGRTADDCYRYQAVFA